MKLARYEWVAVIDHDDVSLPGRLETQLRTLVDHPEIRVLGTFATEITADGIKIRLRTAFPTTIEEYRILRATGQWVGMVHPSILMHRQTILELGGYDPDFGAAADSELWSRVADDHVVQSLPVPLLRYRVHNKSMSFSRYYEQRHAMRWLRARQNARWRNETPPSQEDFLRTQRGIRSWRRVNYRRQDLVHLFSWRARLAQAHGNRARATGWDFLGLLLSPKRASHVVWRRVKRP
jgi:glycosyltransferase involved in cell wall biosynthesis